MGNFIPVEPEKWAEMVKALAENARLKAEVERLTERNKFLEQIDSYLQGANEHSFEQRCDELEAEVERLRKAGEWQSIETAPKDGTKVLVYDESYGLPQKAWFGKDDFDEEHEGWLFGDGDDYSCGLYFTPINPTHWMPLPKPPQEGKQS